MVGQALRLPPVTCGYTGLVFKWKPRFADPATESPGSQRGAALITFRVRDPARKPTSSRLLSPRALRNVARGNTTLGSKPFFCFTRLIRLATQESVAGLAGLCTSDLHIARKFLVNIITTRRRRETRDEHRRFSKESRSSLCLSSDKQRSSSYLELCYCYANAAMIEWCDSATSCHCLLDAAWSKHDVFSVS